MFCLIFPNMDTVEFSFNFEFIRGHCDISRNTDVQSRLEY
jgi:hypothetical protein